MKIKNKLKDNLKNSSWIKNRRFLSIFFKFFLIIGIIITSIISIFFSIDYFVKTNNNNGEFGDTYNIKYEVDLEVNPENKNLAGSNDNSLQSSEARLKKVASSFENWLFTKKIYNNGVQYSIKEKEVLSPSSQPAYVGWIFTNLYNIKDVSFLQFEDVKQDPMRVINDNTANNFVEIIPYDKNLTPQNNPKNNEILINTLGLNVENGKVSETIKESEINSSLDLEGVEFRIDNAVNIEQFMDYKAGLNDPSTSGSNYKWFVFNDLDKLVQRLNYVKSVAYWNNAKNHQEYIRLGNEGLLPITLYDQSLYEGTTPPGVNNLNHIRFLYEALSDDEKKWGDIAATSADAAVAVTKKNVLDFYNQFDSTSTSGSKDKTTGNFDASIQPIVKNYIIGEITYQNYHMWFPEAHELSAISEESRSKNSRLAPPGTIAGPKEVRTFKIPFDESITLPNFLFLNGNNKSPWELLTFFKDYSSFAPIVSFNRNSIIPDKTEPLSFYGSGNILPPLIKDSIIGLSAYESIFLASGIILLTIGIIVSIIYRVPGLIATLSIAFTTTVTIAFSGLLGLTFSFGSFLAIILGTILTLSSVIIFLERIRKNIIDNKSIFDSSWISINKSIATILDIHIVSIIIGLVVALLGTLEMIDFGFELILTSLTSLISVFFIFIFVQYGFSKSKLFWNKKLYFSRIEKKIRNHKEDEAKFIKIMNSSFGLSKWSFIVVIGIFISVIITVITLLFTIGIPNSLDFKSGTSLYIYQGVNVNEVINAIGGNWTIKISTDN
ncbi:MAG: hypothetical protein ACRCVI_01530, partial [Mycoplasmoidaceae bacterium]